jgi:hypothetical protein
MALPTTIEEAIEKAALGPATVTIDGQTVTAKDIAQLIEADRYLAAKTAATKSHFGLRFTKLVPPGTG